MKKPILVERKISSERWRYYAMNYDRAQLEQNLTQPMLDAEREIERYFNKQTRGLGYATLDPHRADKLIVHHDDLSDFDQNRLSDLATWKKHTPSAPRGIVIDIAVFSFPVDDVADQRGFKPHEIRMLYNVGLNEYCKIRGWGDQLEKNS